MKLLFLLPFCLLIACSSLPEEGSAAPNRGELAAQIPTGMRANPTKEEEFKEVLLPGEKESKSKQVTSNQGGSSILPALPDSQDLVWTDPDNPDQDLGNVEAAFTKPIKDPWQLSFQAATRLSYAEGKPLMIWFTDSRRSPTCKTLGRELFVVKEFEKWSEENVIKLRVDLNPSEQNGELLKKKQAYARALRKKFRVKGSPTVLVIGNNGETVGRYSGYSSGSGNFYWGRLKNAVSVIDSGYFDWRTRMENKGYRMWKGKNGVELFAKLLKYKEGDLQVVEPNGRKTGFHESNLSQDDLKWIEKEREKRNKV